MKYSQDEQLNIYIVTHKKFVPPIDGCYIPLLVGAIGKKDLSNLYLCDNSGDNISDRNDGYCELTGLYWMWKNTNCEYVGLVHYRRYFVQKGLLRCGSRYYSLLGRKAVRILKEQDVRNILQTKDVIVKQSRRYKVSIEELFKNHSHIGNDKWRLFKDTVLKMNPEYKNEFIAMQNGHCLINCNMFIGRKQMIDKYCQWLFTILFELDNINYIKTGSYFCNREMGYFAEFLFGIWLKHNNVNYCIVDAVNFGETESEDSILPLWKIVPRGLEKIKSML